MTLWTHSVPNKQISMVKYTQGQIQTPFAALWKGLYIQIFGDAI